MTRSVFFLLSLHLVAGAGLSTTARAETPPSVPTLPPPPTIEGEIELPKQSPMDRQKSTAQVKALQVMEAQKSGMMCQMMRQMAMQEPNPQTKMMMFMMAQQSCDSSEASKKAAEENEKNRKLISQEDVPKMQKLKASGMPLDYGTSKAPDETQNLDAFRVKLDENAPRNDDAIPVSNPASLVAALGGGPDGRSEVVSTKELAEAAREKTAGSSGASVSALPGIPSGNGAQRNDGRDNAGGGAGVGMMAMGGGGGNAAGANAADGSKSAAPDGAAAAPPARGKSRETNAGAGASSGGGGEAPAKGSSDAFEALLAQMLGPPPEAEVNGFNAGETVSMTEQTAKGPPTTNIFEYATLRYRRLGQTQRVVAAARSRGEPAGRSAATSGSASPRVANPPVPSVADGNAPEPSVERAKVATGSPSQDGAVAASSHRSTTETTGVGHPAGTGNERPTVADRRPAAEPAIAPQRATLR
jgi:hypothetical protein